MHILYSCGISGRLDITFYEHTLVLSIRVIASAGFSHERCGFMLCKICKVPEETSALFAELSFSSFPFMFHMFWVHMIRYNLSNFCSDSYCSDIFGKR